MALPAPMLSAEAPTLPTSPCCKSGDGGGDVSLDDIWRDCDECLACMPMSTPEDLDSDDDEAITAHRGRNASISVCLSDGTIHVCGRGHFCPFAVPNDDRMLVCPHTGVVVGPERTDEFFDLNGGMGKKSSDPDQCCGEPQYGRWLRRADPMLASRNAVDHADNIDDAEEAEAWDADAARKMVATYNNVTALSTRSGKRGARCVGESRESDGLPCSKRSRLSKKNIVNLRVQTTLRTEAQQVLSKLIDYDRSITFKQKRIDNRIERKRPPPDPRMCNEKFVFAASVRKYLKNCAKDGTAPSMDALHNLSLMAKQVSAQAQGEAQASNLDVLRTVNFRTACASLIVLLWSVACTTPYMQEAKRGTDAFRPFVCGCIYGFKRGVKLANGAVLIPTFPTLGNALPALRGTGGNTVAKTLHSSSHRGMCTLSRCIASVPAADQDRIFSPVVQMATSFVATTFRASDI
tara:strand:- start:4695 stop:6083 length:1389 start_codon:yes stop_codon:yes gene_type:complete